MGWRGEEWLEGSMERNGAMRQEEAKREAGRAGQRREGSVYTGGGDSDIFLRLQSSDIRSINQEVSDYSHVLQQVARLFIFCFILLLVIYGILLGILAAAWGSKLQRETRGKALFPPCTLHSSSRSALALLLPCSTALLLGMCLVEVQVDELVVSNLKAAHGVEVVHHLPLASVRQREERGREGGEGRQGGQQQEETEGGEG
eukprot:746910-Hanusia_phi.AAC.3